MRGCNLGTWKQEEVAIVFVKEQVEVQASEMSPTRADMDHVRGVIMHIGDTDEKVCALVEGGIASGAPLYRNLMPAAAVPVVYSILAGTEYVIDNILSSFQAEDVLVDLAEGRFGNSVPMTLELVTGAFLYSHGFLSEERAGSVNPRRALMVMARAYCDVRGYPYNRDVSFSLANCFSVSDFARRLSGENLRTPVGYMGIFHYIWEKVFGRDFSHAIQPVAEGQFLSQTAQVLLVGGTVFLYTFDSDKNPRAATEAGAKLYLLKTAAASL